MSHTQTQQALTSKSQEPKEKAFIKKIPYRLWAQGPAAKLGNKDIAVGLIWNCYIWIRTLPVTISEIAVGLIGKFGSTSK
jgi:hypothetical protein